MELQTLNAVWLYLCFERAESGRSSSRKLKSGSEASWNTLRRNINVVGCIGRGSETPCEYETQFDSCFHEPHGSQRWKGGWGGLPLPPQKRGCSLGRATDPTSCRIQPLILPITNSTTLSLSHSMAIALASDFGYDSRPLAVIWIVFRSNLISKSYYIPSPKLRILFVRILIWNYPTWTDLNLIYWGEPWAKKLILPVWKFCHGVSQAPTRKNRAPSWVSREDQTAN